MLKNKNIDCVKMTRDIRDEIYSRNKDKSLKDFAKTLVEEAHKSVLWKNVKVIGKMK